MGILSPYYGTTAFDGVSFFELGAWYQGMTVESDGTYVQDVGTYIDMGRAPIIFELQAGVEGTQKAALLGKRGDSGTLVWSRGTQTVTLLDITPAEADISGLDGNTLTLKFFSDDLPAGAISTSTSAIVTESGDPIITEASEAFITE